MKGDMDSPPQAVEHGGADFHRWMMGLLSSAPSINGYSRLRPDHYERRARRSRRSVKIARFTGSGQNSSSGGGVVRRRASRFGGGLRLRARLRVCLRWMNPMAKALARLRDAYVNMMLNLAASSRAGGNSMAALASFSYQSPYSDLPFGPRPLKEYHPSVILAAYQLASSPSPSPLPPSLSPTPATA